MLDRSRSRDRSKAGGAFSPAGLFVSGAQGAWYDPSDFSTLFQNAAGTTPVTAVEQPVRLMLDRSRGLVLGGELVTINSATLTGSTGFTAITGASCVAGRSYSVSYTCVLTGGTIQGVVGGTALTSTSVSGTFSFIVVATSSVAPQFYSSAGVGSISNYSVRELPGNHALAPNDASRPVLRARYNQLTNTEDLSAAIWSKNNATVVANQYVDSQGTSTLDRVLPTAGNATHYLQYTITYTATQYTLSFEARYDNHRWIAVTTWDGTTNRNASFDLLNGVVGVTSGGATSSITSLGSGLYRCVVTFTPLGVSGNFTIGPNDIDSASIRTWNAAGTEAFGLGRASLLTAADQTATGGAYQRIAAATDYDTSNPVWRPYLAFDGSDDHMVLASAINITTDMTVVRGFGRSAAGIRSIGLGTSGVNIYDGYWFTDNTTVSAMGGSGAVLEAANTATGSFVFASRRNASTSTVRRNGTQIGSVSAPSVINSFGAIGLMNTVYNNGPIYGLIVLDRELTGSELTATEQWMAGKTGATLA